MWLANAFSIRLQGGRPTRITPLAEGTIDFTKFDGLLVGGGDDIDAQLYGGMPAPNVRIDPERDELEIGAIQHFLSNGIPVLGVCRGAQMINVALGGSLHADIYDVYEAAPRLRTVLARKRIRIQDGTTLHRISGLETTWVNSLHHQSIDRLGQQLRVSARDEHDIVQAIESDRTAGPFLTGVQWHPEFLPYRKEHRRIFEHFVAAAASTANTRSAHDDATSVFAP